LLYLFNALMVGAGVMQLSAKYPILQQTIVLFIIGFICSLCLKGLQLKDKIAVWGDSYDMWMSIDPHLLLFTLLPALLAGDAMTIDTSVAKRVGFQCIYLAGPGVLIGAFATAGFLHIYPGTQWETTKNFALSICTGAMLCATDPVAVVALLKELGASPMLTVQIQGESLLNDGTAIVLYLISYNILTGLEYDGLDIIAFLLEKALMAFALGLFIGYFFFGWIRAVSNKLDHAAGMIQITLTLCAAYWSFIFVEGILKLSGVLATVACSLVLAHHMWPYICNQESMHHVWHTFEALGNVIVFFLAGSITGFIVLDIDAVDWLHLLVIYIVLLFIRSFIFAFSGLVPVWKGMSILQMLHADKLPVRWQEACLMTWGGLRGAVGLALAIQVNIGRAPCCDPLDDDKCKVHCSTAREPQIVQKDAERILFFVSGIAFLTTLVNATTAPALVQKLKITALPSARQTLLRMFHQQLVNWSEDSSNPPEVTISLKAMLHEAAEEIEHTQISGDGPKAVASRQAIGSSPAEGEEEDHKKALMETEACQDNKTLLSELAKVRDQYNKIPAEDLELLGGELPENLLGKTEGMELLIANEGVDGGMAKVVNQVFLTLVYNNYWEQIRKGALRPGSPESDVLLTSVRISLSPYRIDLVDFNYVHEKMIGKEEVVTDDVVGEEFGALAEEVPNGVATEGCLPKFVNSGKFNIFIAVAILLNSITVCVEELARTDANKDNLAWLITDAIFTAIFVVEFFLKFAWLKCAYYKDSWNKFDFCLVIVGVFGVVMNVMTQGGSNFAGTSRVMRLARVLRTMRFLRVFRLFHAKLSADKFVSLDLAKHMKKITTMNNFITAHLMAQTELMKYFGGNGEIDEADESEIARCILQSMVAVFKALISCAKTKKLIADDNPKVLHELKTLYSRKTITEGLSHFVEKAYSDGAISATEAHAILHPLNHEVSACMKKLNDRAEGVIQNKSDPMMGHHAEKHAPEAQAKENPSAMDMAPDAEDPAPGPPTIAVPSAVSS
jgi:sodium/hydrogen exchanger 10/11